MSQRNPKLIDLDFTPPQGRRGPSALGDASAVGNDEGATGEIRSLIDQLQMTANEARHRLNAVENERDSLAQQAELLQEQSRELRARASESSAMAQQISRLEQQKDDLEVRLAEARALGEVRGATAPTTASADLEHRLASAERAQGEARRQHEEIVRQRDDLSRSVEALNRSVHDLNSRFLAAQEQLIGLRLARDGAQNQNRELSQKLERQDDEIADLQYRLEKNVAALAAAQAPSPESEAWVEERAQLQRELKEARQALEQARQAPPTPDSVNLEHAATELQEANAARESALAEAVALRAQLERMRQQGEQQGPNSEAFEGLRREREAVLVQLQISTREVIDLREQLQGRTAEIEAQKQARDAIASTAAEMHAQFSVLAAEREAAVRSREEALTSAAAAQKQIERLARERDLLRDMGTDNTVSMEAQMDELRQKNEQLQAESRRQATAGDDVKHDTRELTARLEAQRLESIELVARLQAAELQVRNLGASLAEARLQARAAAPRAEKPSAPATPKWTPAPPEAAEGLLSVVAPAAPVAALTVLPPPAPPAAPAPFPTSDSYDALRAMRRCYNAYARDPEDLSHLNEFHCAALTFSEQARAAGCVAVHRIGVALATLMQELYHFPEQITSEVLTSIVQTIEFITALLKSRDLTRLKDPATGLVCVVDDDPATRECIIMAMESVMVQTISFQEPSEALCALAKTHCDLVILDVQMPGMDGYELCSQIRQHSRHQHTPVAFVTGQSSAEVRARCALCGGTDFLTKPFILAELSLKALIMMMRAELPFTL